MGYSKFRFWCEVSNRKRPWRHDNSRTLHRMKRIKKCGTEEDPSKSKEEDQDRISKLPDAILYSIILFLPFREAARTSVLSKRWRYVWTLYPNFNFQLQDIFGEDNFLVRFLNLNFRMSKCFGEDSSLVRNLNRSGNEEHRKLLSLLKLKFVKAVDQILHVHKMSKVDLFRVDFVLDDMYASHLRQWVKHAAVSGVEKLDLNIVDDEYPFFPSKTFWFSFRSFASKARNYLKYLHLQRCNFDIPNSFVGFKFLKTLNLEYVWLTERNLKRLLSKCLCLEWLRLKRCEPLSKLKISSAPTQLKYLSILKCLKLEEIEVGSVNVATFECPKSSVTFFFEEVPNMVEAWFHVASISDNLTNLPNITSQLEKLTLNFSTEDIPVPRGLPIFKNIKLLVLCGSILRDLDLLWVFSLAKHFPFLQELQIHLIELGEAPGVSELLDELSRTRALVPAPPLHHLKVVEISGFLGTWRQVELLKHLLHHAVHLELMIIRNGQKFYLGDGEWHIFPSCKSAKRKAHKAYQLLCLHAPPSVDLILD